MTPFSTAKCLPEEMDADKRTELSQTTTLAACLRLGLGTVYLFCLGYGFASSERLDSIICLLLSNSLTYITISGVGREERCCSDIPHSAVKIFLFLSFSCDETFLHLASRGVVQYVCNAHQTLPVLMLNVGFSLLIFE